MTVDTDQQSLAVRAENVSFAYDATLVLRGLSLKLHLGEFVVVVGKSGSGKTTLLRSIAGHVTTEGQISVSGVVRSVFQEDRLFPWYTAAQNIRIALKDGSRSQARQWLDQLGMSDLADRYPHELSGGQKQRVAIARAFAARPDVVLMDEPFNALDVLTREELQTWLLSFWEISRVAVLFVTHDVEEAIVLGDRIAVLRGGQLFPALRVPFDRPRTHELRFTSKFLAARKTVRDQLVESSNKEKGDTQTPPP